MKHIKIFEKFKLRSLRHLNHPDFKFKEGDEVKVDNVLGPQIINYVDYRYPNKQYEIILKQFKGYPISKNQKYWYNEKELQLWSEYIKNK